MIMPIQLSIVTPESEAVKLTCDEVAAPGINGELGILPGHVPVITALKPGILKVIQGNKRTVYAVGAGFAELEGEQLTVLTDVCEIGGDVNTDKARAELAEAEKALAELGEDDAQFTVHRLRLERAQARLTAADLK